MFNYHKLAMTFIVLEIKDLNKNSIAYKRSKYNLENLNKRLIFT